MATYNGLLASMTLNGSTASQVLANQGVSFAKIADAVPMKYFSFGQFAIRVSGVSGTIGVEVVGAVGGATYVIAGRTNITASGGFPIPLVAYVGTSGTVPLASPGIPRPAYVAFANGNTAVAGITASVYLAADYN